MPDNQTLTLTFKTLTPQTWDDVVKLFGPNGAHSGCWCQWFKVTNREFDELGNAGKRAAFKDQVDAGHMPGILAYHEGQPVGWCAIEPRERYGRLARSPVTKPLDEQPVYSLTCFYVDKHFRRRGITGGLIKAAIKHVKAQGGNMIEAYPKDPKQPISNQDAYYGLMSTFKRLGFKEVARRSETRSMMRLEV
jgi:GNAT superfamily N-acetyltransferase